MKRCLAIGFPYIADRFGGSTASSLILARALRESGHAVHILAHGDGAMVGEARDMGLPVTQLPALSAAAAYARPDRFRLEQMFAFRACRAAIQRLELDVVHTNDSAMLRTWTAPAVASSAALVAHWRTNFKRSWSIEAALRVARVVIAVSGYSFSKLPEWVQRKATVEYNPFDMPVTGMDRDSARQTVCAELGLPRDAVLIGIFGNHLVRKRTNVLADILAAMERTDSGRPIFGLACGTRAEPYDLLLDEKIAAFGLGERLLRPGFVRPVERWMSACDVVLSPAIDEPLARNVLEAQTLGVPVVVSTDGGLRELIESGSSGVLCDPYDLAAWIQATRHILNDRAFAQHLARNGARLVGRLRPQEHAVRVASLYRQHGFGAQVAA